MHAAARHSGTEWSSTRHLLGWMLAFFLVGVAILGPPLTGQGVRALVEIRHAVLMIDREFEWAADTGRRNTGAATRIFAEASDER
jgi:hypothetical protein